MTNDSSSLPEEQPSEKDSQFVDMAALLFAELFYKQVMAERLHKQQGAKNHGHQPPGSDDVVRKAD